MSFQYIKLPSLSLNVGLHHYAIQNIKAGASSENLLRAHIHFNFSSPSRNNSHITPPLCYLIVHPSEKVHEICCLAS